jgi:hypothetical protein
MTRDTLAHRFSLKLWQQSSPDTTSVAEAGPAWRAVSSAEFRLTPRVLSVVWRIGTVAFRDALGGSALTLIGKLAQIVQCQVSGWRVVVGVPDKVTRPAVVLPSADRPSSDCYGSLAAAIATTKRRPYRALQDVRSISSQPHLTVSNLWSLPRRHKTDLDKGQA